MKKVAWHTKRLIGTLGILGLMVGTAAIVGMACSCASEADALLALEKADAVFAGRVVALELVTRFDEDPTVSFTTEDLMVTVAVHSRWKGDAADQMVLYTAFTCCVCGFSFQIGEEYLIYAYANEDGTLRTSMCSRTAILEGASADLVLLGNLIPASLAPGGGEMTP